MVASLVDSCGVLVAQQFVAVHAQEEVMADRDSKRQEAWCSLGLNTVEPFLKERGLAIDEVHNISNTTSEYSVVEKSKPFSTRGEAVAEAFRRYVVREGL
jgi:hypothetical protein